MTVGGEEVVVRIDLLSLLPLVIGGIPEGMVFGRYFVGIGPKLFSFRRGETEYRLKALPFGGFCEIAGMTTLDELTPDEERRAMWKQKTWKRTTVMAAGPITHFVLGFVILYALAVTFGLPNLAEKPVVSATAACVTDARTTDQLTNPTCPPGSKGPAEAAGIRPGDEIVAVNGTPTPTWTEMSTAVRNSRGPTVFEVQRGNERLRFTVDVPTVTRPATTTEGNAELVALLTPLRSEPPEQISPPSRGAADDGRGIEPQSPPRFATRDGLPAKNVFA